MTRVFSVRKFVMSELFRKTIESKILVKSFNHINEKRKKGRNQIIIQADTKDFKDFENRTAS